MPSVDAVRLLLSWSVSEIPFHVTLERTELRVTFHAGAGFARTLPGFMADDTVGYFRIALRVLFGDRRRVP